MATSPTARTRCRRRCSPRPCSGRREGVPESPQAWLVTVAAPAPDRPRPQRGRPPPPRGRGRRRRSRPTGRRSDRARDDTLTLLLLCCHPALSAPSQLALTLRAVGGLTTAEIARPSWCPRRRWPSGSAGPSRRIKETGVPFAAAREERADRMRVVLHVLYLIFNEGYTATSGPAAAARRPDRRGDPAARMLHALLPARRRSGRAAGADAAHRRPARGAHRARRRADPAGRSGPRPLERRRHRRGHRADRAHPGHRPARPVPGAGGHRRGPRRGAPGRGHRLAADPLALPPAATARAQPDGAAEPGRRRGDGRRTGRPAWPSSTASPPTSGWPATTASTPYAPICWRWPATPTPRGRRTWPRPGARPAVRSSDISSAPLGWPDRIGLRRGARWHPGRRLTTDA